MITSNLPGLIGGAALGGAASELENGFVNGILSLGRTPRYMGGIRLKCVIREQHTDSQTITDHPVEFGAPISDHKYADPTRVQVKIMDTTLGVNDMYQTFLEMMDGKDFIEIVTGKRTYSNMVIQAIEEITDAETENVLGLLFSCRQVIIAFTSTITPGSKDSPLSLGSKLLKAAPQLNSAVQQVMGIVN